MPPLALLVGASLALNAPLSRSIDRSSNMCRQRRDFVGLAASALSTFAVLPAGAYDSLPTAASAPDPAALAEERAKRKRERVAKAAKKNAEASTLVSKVQASSAPAEFVEAIDALSLWIIAQGAPRTCVGACQWLTADDASPLPEGFQTRELVATCKASLKALPQLAYACEMTRENKGVCFSSGPQAEGAYQAFLSELRKRAPLQYETPYGPVPF